jgi:ABC-type dipeptide/oligopeptide/nickel transport system permease component
MKKLLLAATTLVLLSTASFADQNTENMNKMDEMRMSFMKMTDQMVDSQMQMLKMNEEMLTSYKRFLKQMMENELSSHKG